MRNTSLLLTLVALVVACTDLDLGPQRWRCVEWDDCPAGEGCLAGVCRPEMVLIPAGPFRRGCDDDLDGRCKQPDGGAEYCANAEIATPSYEVTLPAYWIDVTEVWVGTYSWCVEDGPCVPPPPIEGAACNWGAEVREEHPVNCVTHADAQTFCEWAGKRLCSEAEWEKAARGEDGRPFPWGGAAPAEGPLANCQEEEPGACRDGTAGTTPVGAFPAGESAHQLVDMAGNVAEWLADYQSDSLYSECFAKGPTDGCRVDPRVTEDLGQGFAVRGGSFANPTSCLRTYSRVGSGLGLSDRADWIGFRCCVSVEP